MGASAHPGVAGNDGSTTALGDVENHQRVAGRVTPLLQDELALATATAAAAGSCSDSSSFAATTAATAASTAATAASTAATAASTAATAASTAAAAAVAIAADALRELRVDRKSTLFSYITTQVSTLQSLVHSFMGPFTTLRLQINHEGLVGTAMQPGSESLLAMRWVLKRDDLMEGVMECPLPEEGVVEINVDIQRLYSRLKSCTRDSTIQLLLPRADDGSAPRVLYIKTVNAMSDDKSGVKLNLPEAGHFNLPRLAYSLAARVDSAYLRSRLLMDGGGAGSSLRAARNRNGGPLVKLQHYRRRFVIKFANQDGPVTTSALKFDALSVAQPPPPAQQAQPQQAQAQAQAPSPPPPAQGADPQVCLSLQTSAQQADRSAVNVSSGANCDDGKSNWGELLSCGVFSLPLLLSAINKDISKYTTLHMPELVELELLDATTGEVVRVPGLLPLCVESMITPLGELAYFIKVCECTDDMPEYIDDDDCYYVSQSLQAQ